MTDRINKFNNCMAVILVENGACVFMNKLLVLAKNKETYFIKRLLKEGGERIIIFNPWSDEVTPAIEKLSRILVRTTGVYGGEADLLFLKRQPSYKKIMNSLLALETFRSKKRQYEFFDKFGIPSLPWLDLQISQRDDLENFIKAHPAYLYLIKPHRGQAGWGITTFTAEELLNWFQERFENQGDLEYLLQVYHGEAQELRFFFTGEDWSATLERIREVQKVAANFGQGGGARRVVTPESFFQILKIIRREIPLYYGAIDALIIQGSPVILEVNTCPGIEQLEAVTGESVINRILKGLE